MELSLLVILINLVAIILLMVKNWLYIKKIFRMLSKRTWICLLLIFILSVFLRITLPVNTHKTWVDEVMYIDAAKNIIKNLSFGTYGKSIGWPFILSLVFRIFPISSQVAIKTSIFFGALTILPIFFITYLITDREEAGLLSSLIFCLMPAHINWSASAETNVVSLFFICVSVFFYLLYYKRQKNSILWLCQFTSMFTMQIRPENYVLPLVFLIGCFLFISNFHKKLRGEFVLSFIVYLFLIPHTIEILRYYGSTNYIIQGSDGKLTGSNWNILNLISNSITYGPKIFGKELQPALNSLLILLGIIYLAKNKPKHLTYLLVWFILPLLVLFTSWFQTIGSSFHIFSKTRLLIIFFPITVLFAASGVLLVNDILKNNLSKYVSCDTNVFSVFALIIIVVFLPFLRSETIYTFPAQELETNIINKLENDLPINCTIILNYPVILSSVTSFNTVSTSEFLRNRAYDFEGKCYLFFEDGACVDWGNPRDKAMCEYIKSNYTILPYKSYSGHNIKYTFYYIFGKK